MANIGRKPNASSNTAMPARVKSGLENMSGQSMSGVNVHHNSGRPAQLQAHASTQGTNIHVAPGQSNHLPHEATHVAQQRQGRVQPTMQMAGGGQNQGRSLESQADKMGARAMHGAIKK